MAPPTPELRKQIMELAATLDGLSVTYRYTKARCLLDPEFAEKNRQAKQRSQKKRYDEDPEFRAKMLQASAKNQSKANDKRQAKYHTDEEYRQRVREIAKASYQRRKLAKAEDIPTNIVDT